MSISSVFLGMLLLGLFAGPGNAIPVIVKSLASMGWEKADCTVASSRLIKGRGTWENRFKADIVYSYSYAGKTYRSNTYRFAIDNWGGWESEAAIVEGHPPGTRTECFVKPGDPTRSVLVRTPDLRISPAMIFVALTFIPMGVFGIYRTFVNVKPKGDYTRPRITAGSPCVRARTKLS